jgi:diguanylate cyclase (GGDEF)-like protein/PAS domain S-box-containing protein
MHPGPLSTADEPARLQALRELFILDTEPEPLFDALARQAAEACGTPIGLVNLVDADRQWFKARFGLPDLVQTPRDVAFCAHTILGGGLFEVADATRDSRFANNPLVIGAPGAPGVRFYAGLPLTLPGGERVGTLCVADHQPRALTPQQRKNLQSLAELATLALEMRRQLLQRALRVRSDYETQLALNASHYRAIVEDQTELVSVAHPDGTLVYVNRAYAGHFGKPATELLGTSLFDYIEPSDRAGVRERLARVATQDEVISSENRMAAADGSERWVAWTNKRQVGADGRTLLHSVGRDVSDRKRAEAALRASQSMLARSGRVAGVGGWELELGSGRLTWSDETRRIHEVPDDFVPTLDNAVGFYAPEARAAIEAAVQHAIASGEGWDLELPLVTANGRRIWARAVGEVEQRDGHPVRLIGAFQDVTQRRQLEQQVADSERFLRQLTDSLPLRLAYIDPQRRYRFANQAMLQAFGRDAGEVMGRTRAELRPGEDDTPFAQRASAALAGQAQQFEFDEPVGTQKRRFENRLVPDHGDDGQVRGFFVTGIDITQRSAAESALRELTAIFDNTTDFVVQTDAGGGLSYLNPSARDALGLAPDERLAGRAFSDFLSADSRQLFAQAALPTVRAGGVWVGETTLDLPGRSAVPMSHMVLAHRDAGGRIERFSSVLRDISAAHAARQEITRQSETLRLVAEALPASVAVVGSEGRYRFVNSAFQRGCGLPLHAILGREAREVLGDAEFERRLPFVRRALAGDAVTFELDTPADAGQQHLQFTYVPLRLASGGVDGIVAIAQDITPHKREEGRLRSLAQRDALTGLLNRAGFEAALDALQARRTTLAVLYIDLDRFKPVNDTHGHPVGDAVLQQFARRLSQVVRAADVVARLGGDEFAIAIPALASLHVAQKVADNVMAAAAAPFRVGALEIGIGASVGLACGDLGQRAWAEVVAQADEGLLRAKAGGRGRLVMAAP